MITVGVRFVFWVFGLSTGGAWVGLINGPLESKKGERERVCVNVCICMYMYM